MAENKIELKSVSDLLGMKFYIPSYQRGYRWTEQQVKDLLEDIWEFSQKKKEDSSEFYCLQPLVVKRKDEDVLNQIKNATSIEEVKFLLNGSWEVIDGQQRLTTINVMLYLLSTDESYSIEYSTRTAFQKLLDNCKESYHKCEDYTKWEEYLKYRWQYLLDIDKCFDNIDFYHIFMTFHVASRWLETDANRKEIVKNTLLNRVKFIWYQTFSENPIKVFTRLNVGKIPLTNAELIKALMLNSSNFSDKEENHLRLLQQEIASKWDDIEYTLQNDEFWFFLHPKGYDRPTRIDFIFDLIVEKNPWNVFSEIGTDEYRTFRYFYEFFKNKKSEEGVKQCWSEVKRYFQIFNEWFNDLEMYHYVGFLVERKVELSKIIDDWKGDKEIFVSELKEIIREQVKSHSALEEIYEVEYPDKDGNTQKGVTKTACKPILLLHNIQTVINQANISNEKYQQSVFYKFPFHLYKTEGWDVEHIDSNTENDLSDKDSQNEFLLNVYHSVDENTQDEIKSFIENARADNWKDFADYTVHPDKGLTQYEKNQIWNYTLLDSSTNRSYGNSIFSAKRRIIIGKDRGVLLPIPKIKRKDGKSVLYINKEQKADSAFIPPCTKYVFLKYYSSVSTDYNYWTVMDADAYRKSILKTLKEFGVTLNGQNNE